MHNARSEIVQLPPTVSAKLHADPAANNNLSAFVTVVVDYFIAFERRIARPRASAVHAVEMPPLLASTSTRHRLRYARAAGGRSVADLIAAALTLHYSDRVA